MMRYCLSIKNLKIKIVSILLLLFFSTGFSQPLNVKINSTAVNSPNEPSISINHMDTKDIVAGSNLNYFYRSKDGGRTWTSSILRSSLSVHGDPCVISDYSGNFYYFHLSSPPRSSIGSKIVCQKLKQGDSTWTDGSFMGLNQPKFQDKEWGIVDPLTDNIYVTWTQFDKYGSPDSNHFSNIMFSSSNDGGETWSKAKSINRIPGDCLDGDNTTEGAVPAVGPNGEIYVSWAGPAGLVFDRSKDRGKTWLKEDIFVSDFPAGWDLDIPGINRCNGMPVTICDISNSPYRGTIYINWSDQRNGTDDTDIWMAKSIDGGNTWSSPKRVNDDPPGRHQFFTWMAIDQTTGYLYIVFYDRRNYDDLQTDVYLAVSKNGGETFKNHKISWSPFTPNSGVFFGDYTNISAHDKIVRPIWTRLNGGRLSLWTAIIDHNVNIDEYYAEDVYLLNDIEIISVGPNPMRYSALIKYRLPETGKFAVNVYDVNFNKVVTLYTGIKEAGTYDILWRPKELPGGVYIVCFESGDIRIARKILYMK
ncbi:sialidase family protein [candidate division KSB1 bacterium]